MDSPMNNEPHAEIEEKIQKQLDRIEKKVDEKFELFDRKLADEKKFLEAGFRFSMKVPTFIFSAVAVIIVVTSIYSGISVERERSRIEASRKELTDGMKALRRELRKEIETTLGLTKKQPSIAMFAAIDKPLDGQTLDTTVKMKEDSIIIYFRFIIRNTGKAVTAPLSIKVYTRKPLKFPTTSSDEKDWDYETWWKTLHGAEALPPGASQWITGYFRLKSAEPHVTFDKIMGVHPIFLKVYYGNEIAHRSEFLKIQK